MGSSNIILAMCCCVLLLWPVAHAFDPSDSLDSVIHGFALKNNTSRRRTGRLYNVVLPANFSGIQASIVSLKSGSVWKRGANFSFFQIPPGVLPQPFVRRIEIVYENLGNWSFSYFNHVPNHTFVSPVIGLKAYDENRRNQRYGEIELSVMDEPILVHFPDADDQNGTIKCVRFGANGAVELSNVRLSRTCIARGTGHFSLVIPSPAVEKESRIWKWLVVGIVGLVLLVGMTCLILYNVVKAKRIGNMERLSEKSESLGIVWVGRSRMPCAPSIRTQPVLENTYVP